MENTEFADKIKQLRIEKHLNQVQAAQFLKIPHSTYRNWECKQCEPVEFVKNAVIEKLGKYQEAS